jgi:hypothetical protein
VRWRLWMWRPIHKHGERWAKAKVRAVESVSGSLACRDGAWPKEVGLRRDWLRRPRASQTHCYMVLDAARSAPLAAFVASAGACDVRIWQDARAGLCAAVARRPPSPRSPALDTD